MSQQSEGGVTGPLNMRLTWLITALITLAILWLIYSATQESIVSSNAPLASTMATTMPDSMPGMNH